MVGSKHKPTANGLHSVYVSCEEYKSYLKNTLDKFLDEYVFGGDDKTVASDDETATTDGVWSYGINILKSFLLLEDIKSKPSVYIERVYSCITLCLMSQNSQLSE